MGSRTLGPEGGGFRVWFTRVERAGGWGICHCDFLSQEAGLVGSEAASCPKPVTGQSRAPVPQLSPSRLPFSLSTSAGPQALPPQDPAPTPPPSGTRNRMLSRPQLSHGPGLLASSFPPPPRPHKAPCPWAPCPGWPLKGSLSPHRGPIELWRPGWGRRLFTHLGTWARNL